MSRKQKIYTEMLFWSVPYIRNIQTQSIWNKAFDKSCYEEAELVHNLGTSILDPEFVEHDIHFLNTQAKNYVLNGGKILLVIMRNALLLRNYLN